MDRGAAPSFAAVRVSLADLSCVTDVVEAGTPRPDAAVAVSTGRTEAEVNGKDAGPSPAGSLTLRARPPASGRLPAQDRTAPLKKTGIEELA